MISRPLTKRLLDSTAVSLRSTLTVFVGVLLVGFGLDRLSAFGNPVVLVGGVPVGYLARHLLLGAIAAFLGVGFLLYGLALVVEAAVEAADT